MSKSRGGDWGGCEGDRESGACLHPTAKTGSSPDVRLGHEYLDSQLGRVGAPFSHRILAGCIWLSSSTHRPHLLTPSHFLPSGCIQLSSSTHSFLMGSGAGHPGEWAATAGVQVKGKGLMHTFLLRQDNDSCNDDGVSVMDGQQPAATSAAGSLSPASSCALHRLAQVRHNPTGAFPRIRSCMALHTTPLRACMCTSYVAPHSTYLALHPTALHPRHASNPQHLPTQMHNSFLHACIAQAPLSTCIPPNDLHVQVNSTFLRLCTQPSADPSLTLHSMSGRLGLQPVTPVSCQQHTQSTDVLAPSSASRRCPAAGSRRIQVGECVSASGSRSGSMPLLIQVTAASGSPGGNAVGSSHAMAHEAACDDMGGVPFRMAPHHASGGHATRVSSGNAMAREVSANDYGDGMFGMPPAMVGRSAESHYEEAVQSDPLASPFMTMVHAMAEAKAALAATLPSRRRTFSVDVAARPLGQGSLAGMETAPGEGQRQYGAP